MKMMLRAAENDVAIENDRRNEIDLLRHDLSLRSEDLLAGRSVSAVLVAVIALGMLAMILTVWACW